MSIKEAQHNLEHAQPIHNLLRGGTHKLDYSQGCTTQFKTWTKSTQLIGGGGWQAWLRFNYQKLQGI